MMFFTSLAAIGLMFSLLENLGTYFGQTMPRPLAIAAHLGAFVVWLPALYFAGRLKKHDFWKDSLGVCPLWLQILFYAAVAYALSCFFLFLRNFTIIGGAPVATNGTRALSALWMTFYVTALAFLYSLSRPQQPKDGA